MNDLKGIITELEQQREAIDKAIAALRDAGASSPSAAPRKRQMSEDARRRIAEATRRRWAEQRATVKKAAAKAVTKKGTVKKSKGKKAAVKQ